MENLTRYDPFGEDIGQFLPGFFQPASRRTAVDSLLKMDVVDTEQAYLVSIDLPGLNKEEIHVSVYENQLSINAERREENEAQPGKATILLSERGFGKISRTVALPQALDDTAAQATHQNGVLYLTLPKRASSMAKKLKIN